MVLWIHPEEAEEAIEFLGKAECWGELEKIIKSRGTSDDAINNFELLFYYGGIYGAAAVQPGPKCKIPGTLVKNNGIDYCIHGLMHIEERISYVHKNFRGINNVVCETNLKRLFKLSSLVEQGRIDECKYVPLADTAMSFGTVYGISLISWALSKFRTQEMKKEEALMWQVKAGEDERLLMVIGDIPVFVSDIRLPERLEHSYIQSNVDNHYFSRFCALRSLSHADFIEHFAKENNLKEAHGIYGLMHEPEIAYFLRYPQKAEELKERYRKRPFVNEVPFIGEMPFFGK